MTRQEEEQKVALSHAIATLGRLLPEGMEVTFYRNPGDPRVIVQSKYPDGETTEHFFTRAMH